MLALFLVVLLFAVVHDVLVVGPCTVVMVDVHIVVAVNDVVVIVV